MPHSTFSRSLWERRWGVLGWTLGVFVLDLLMVALWPTIRASSEEYQKILETYPPEMLAFFGDMTDFGTPAGYLETELFSLMLPLLFIVFAIGYGARSIAGEQEAGTLDLLLAHPLSRDRVLWHKAAAGAAILAGLTLVSYVGLLVGRPTVDLDVDPLRLAGAHLLLLFLALVFGALAFFVGAATGRRGLAVGSAAGFAVAAWVLTALARLVEWLEAPRWLSPFHYYQRGRPLQEPLDPVDVLVLGVAAAGLAFAAARTFRRRSLVA